MLLYSRNNRGDCLMYNRSNREDCWADAAMPSSVRTGPHLAPLLGTKCGLWASGQPNTEEATRKKNTFTLWWSAPDFSAWFSSWPVMLLYTGDQAWKKKRERKHGTLQTDMVALRFTVPFKPLRHLGEKKKQRKKEEKKEMTRWQRCRPLTFPLASVPEQMSNA